MAAKLASGDDDGGGGDDVLRAFAARRRTELYGKERRKLADELVSGLRQSHVFKGGGDGSAAPTWKTTTAVDFKQELVPSSEATDLALQNASQQLDAHFRLGNGSSGGSDEDYHVSKTTSDYKMDEILTKPRVVKREIGNNWADVDPKSGGEAALLVSTYADVYKSADNSQLERPHYGKKDTSKLALPLPPDETRAKVSVRLGSEQLQKESDYGASFADPKSAAADLGAAHEAARLLKVAMEYRSNTFREGDYNGLIQHPATTFGVDYGKHQPGLDFKLPKFSQKHDESSDDVIGGDAAVGAAGPRLPKLISQSMQTSQAIKEGAEGKKYHTRAHFEFGSHSGNQLSVYAKDFPLTSQTYETLRGGRPADTKLFDGSESAATAAASLLTSYGADYCATAKDFKTLSADGARNELVKNVEKSLAYNIRFSYNTDGNKSARQRSLFSESYLKPPAARMRTPAKERRAKFDLLRTDGALEQEAKGPQGSENKENYRNWSTLGAEDGAIQTQSRALKLEALKRLKSGRRSHYVLGYARVDHGTTSQGTFQGKPKDDGSTPAAGRSETDPGVEWKHMAASDNTADHLADNQPASKMESLAAQEISAGRKDAKQLFAIASVTKSDFIPVWQQRLTAAQLKQHDASLKSSRKPQASTHFFHTDTSGGNNYQTTAAASFIKPELMSGKVYL